MSYAKQLLVQHKVRLYGLYNRCQTGTQSLQNLGEGCCSMYIASSVSHGAE